MQDKDTKKIKHDGRDYFVYSCRNSCLLTIVGKQQLRRKNPIIRRENLIIRQTIQ